VGVLLYSLLLVPNPQRNLQSQNSTRPLLSNHFASVLPNFVPTESNVRLKLENINRPMKPAKQKQKSVQSVKKH